jgi:hypothetical protein
VHERQSGRRPQRLRRRREHAEREHHAPAQRPRPPGAATERGGDVDPGEERDPQAGAGPGGDAEHAHSLTSGDFGRLEQGGGGERGDGEDAHQDPVVGTEPAGLAADEEAARDRPRHRHVQDERRRPRRHGRAGEHGRPRRAVERSRGDHRRLDGDDHEQPPSGGLVPRLAPAGRRPRCGPRHREQPGADREDVENVGGVRVPASGEPGRDRAHRGDERDGIPPPGPAPPAARPDGDERGDGNEGRRRDPEERVRDRRKLVVAGARDDRGRHHDRERAVGKRTRGPGRPPHPSVPQSGVAFVPGDGVADCHDCSYDIDHRTPHRIALR